jgi:hypothetical protein
VVQSAGNGRDGSATWTYSIADHAFDFLAKGEPCPELRRHRLTVMAG